MCAFGLLLCSVKLSTNEEVAIKVLHLESVRDELDNIQKEISLLSRLDSVYVVQYRGSFLNGTDLNVVMEYMSGGSLRDLIKAGPLQELEVAAVLREVLSGLVFLHAAKVVHRDIKAANILMNGNGKVKIADFGVARELNASKRRFSVVGSPYWMAPEVITAKEGGLYNEKADIWSLGITAIELAKGLPPRASEKPMKVLVSIPTSPPPKLEGSFSSSFKDFVSLCVQIDSNARPSAKDLLAHPFIAQATETSTLNNILDRHAKWVAANPAKVKEHLDALEKLTPGIPEATVVTKSSNNSSNINNGTSSSTNNNSYTNGGAAGDHSSNNVGAAGLGGNAAIGKGSENGPNGEKSIVSVKKSGPFKKTTIDKVKEQMERLDASSVSDSIEDWDLSSTTTTTRTGSPTSSTRESEGTPESPRNGDEKLRKLREGRHPTGDNNSSSDKPRPTLPGFAKRPLEFSTLSASTDENQFGSVIVHQTIADSEASSSHAVASSTNNNEPLEGVDEDAGEEDDTSMTEQQFGSVVIKSSKRKEPPISSAVDLGALSVGSSVTVTGSSTVVFTSLISPDTTKDSNSSTKREKNKRSSAGSSSLQATSATVGARPKSVDEPLTQPLTTSDYRASLSATPGTKREKAQNFFFPHFDPPMSEFRSLIFLIIIKTILTSKYCLQRYLGSASGGQNESDSVIGSVIRRKSADRSSSGHSVSSPSLKERKKDKEAARVKKKKVVTNSTPSNAAALTSESSIALNQVILPVLSKRQSSSSPSSAASNEKIAQLITSFSSLESDSPGFTSEFLVGILQRLEKEQRSLPSLGLLLALHSNREDFSDLSRYLLQRWKSRPEPAQVAVRPTSGDDSYFL